MMKKPDWETMDWGPINKVHDHIKDKLERQNGVLWKEIVTELHAPYFEMPFWVLLYDDSDLEESHEAFKAVLEPHFSAISPVQCTVSYRILTESDDINVDFLNDNAEILAAPKHRRLGKSRESGPKETGSVFAATLSGKRPNN